MLQGLRFGAGMDDLKAYRCSRMYMFGASMPALKMAVSGRECCIPAKASIVKPEPLPWFANADFETYEVYEAIINCTFGVGAVLFTGTGSVFYAGIQLTAEFKSGY